MQYNMFKFHNICLHYIIIYNNTHIYIYTVYIYIHYIFILVTYCMNIHYVCLCWRLVYRTCVFVFFWPMGWGGLGWGGLKTFNGTRTHIWCYASDLVSCTCTHTWCYATDLVSCTCRHTWCYATDLVSCTCAHTWCYATDGFVRGGVGWAKNVQWH